MKTIYLCGAINGCTDAQCKNWRDHVKRRLAPYYHVLDPMRRDFRGREANSAVEIVHGDYADIDASDILLVAAERPSWGTAMEVHYAFSSGRKFIVSVVGQADVSPWLRYHSHRLQHTMDGAIDLLKEIANECERTGAPLLAGASLQNHDTLPELHGLNESRSDVWRKQS